MRISTRFGTWSSEVRVFGLPGFRLRQRILVLAIRSSRDPGQARQVLVGRLRTSIDAPSTLLNSKGKHRATVSICAKIRPPQDAMRNYLGQRKRIADADRSASE